MRAGILVLTLLIGANALADDIPIIGLDKDGNTVESLVSKEQYRENLTTTLTDVQQSAIPVLAQHNKGGAWAIRSFVIGIGFSADVGVGPVLTLSAAPRFRVLFSNAKDPVLP